MIVCIYKMLDKGPIESEKLKYIYFLLILLFKISLTNQLLNSQIYLNNYESERSSGHHIAASIYSALK